MRRLAILFVCVVALVACRREEPLPSLGAVPEFALVDQSGQPVSAATFRGQVWAAAFMFTRCPMICPAVTRAMRVVQERAAEGGVELRLVSFSVDPDNDTPEVLREYARGYGADLATWSFLTGESRVVRSTAENGFKMAVSGQADPSAEGFGITHGTHLVLVDPNLTIRGFYRTSEPEALVKLLHDARGLAR